MEDKEKAPQKYAVPFKKIPYECKNEERVLTGLPDLDYFSKGIEVGVTEIVGDTNTGKSIFTTGLIDSAIDQGYSVGVFAGEHTLAKYKAIMMRRNAKDNEFKELPFRAKNGKDTNIVDVFVTESCQKRVAQKYDDNLFLFDVRRDGRSVDDIVNFVLECYEEHGVRFFVIDNLMEIENNAASEFQEQTQIITKLRNAAIRLKLFLCLVMHTNKSSGSDGFRITMRNAFGSSNLTNKAYNVWFLYRRSNIDTLNKNKAMLNVFKLECAECGFDYDMCDSFVEVAKTKGNSNGVVGMVFDKKRQSFAQASKISQTDADVIMKRYAYSAKRQDTLFNPKDIVELPDDFEMPF